MFAFFKKRIDAILDNQIETILQKKGIISAGGDDKYSLSPRIDKEIEQIVIAVLKTKGFNV